MVLLLYSNRYNHSNHNNRSSHSNHNHNNHSNHKSRYNNHHHSSRCYKNDRSNSNRYKWSSKYNKPGLLLCLLTVQYPSLWCIRYRRPHFPVYNQTRARPRAPMGATVSRGNSQSGNMLVV